MVLHWCVSDIFMLYILHITYEWNTYLVWAACELRQAKCNSMEINKIALAINGPHLCLDSKTRSDFKCVRFFLSASRCREWIPWNQWDLQDFDDLPSDCPCVLVIWGNRWNIFIQLQERLARSVCAPFVVYCRCHCLCAVDLSCSRLSTILHTSAMLRHPIKVFIIFVSRLRSPVVLRELRN